MVLITIVNGVYKPIYNWGAPPCGKRSQFANWKMAVDIGDSPIAWWIFPQLRKRLPEGNITNMIKSLSYW